MDAERWLCVLGGGRLSLFRRCYLVQPPTTACHHGDAMATARCSTREECNLEGVKRLRASPDLIVSASSFKSQNSQCSSSASSYRRSKLLLCMNAALRVAPG